MYRTRIITRAFQEVSKARTVRSLQTSTRALAKNDDSTIDSYRFPSQTSINEWEFKYDFVPKVSEPKVPPISEEAVKQDIAHERKKQVEQEMVNQEVTASVKVEGNHSVVMHGGEHVQDEPELLQDRGSKPVKINNINAGRQSTKPANRDQYLQTSTNPNLNQGSVSNLSDGTIEHKSGTEQNQVVDDLEHDNLHHEGQRMDEKPSGSKNPFFITLGVFGLGAGSFYYMNQKPEKK